MSVVLLIGGTTGGTPVAIVQVAADPIQVQNTAAINTVITGLTLQGLTGSGTWSLVAGSWAKAEINPTTGLNVNLRLNAGLTSADNGPKTATVRYVGETFDITKVINLTVIGATTGPTDIVQSSENPITLLNTATNGQIITGLSLVGGQANGTWSITSTVPTGFSSKVNLSATTGASINLRLAANLSSADEGSKTVNVQYVEGATTLTEAVSIIVTANEVGGAILPWLSGLASTLQDDNTSTPGVESFEREQVIANWRGRPYGMVTVFTGAHKSLNWAQLKTSIGGRFGHIQACCNAGIVPIVSLGVCPFGVNDVGRNRFVKVTDGDFDTDIQATAAKLFSAAGGVRNSSGVITTQPKQVGVRLGWEMNLNSFPWYIGFDTSSTFANYKAAFNRVAQFFLDAIPSCWIVWCVHKDGDIVATRLAEWYPGDARITHITTDNYDASPFANNNYTTWKAKLDRTFNFAVTRNKKWGVDEWGLRREDLSNTVGGADNPQFMEFYYKYFVDAGSRMAYECYFKPDKNFPLANNDDAVHQMILISGSSATEITPFAGKANGNKTDTIGAMVGTNSANATGNAGKRYKDLFGRKPLLLNAGTGVASATFGSAVNVPYPSRFFASDLIILQIAVRATDSSVATPTGFTAFAGNPYASTGNTIRQHLFWKIATGNEVNASVTVNGTTTGRVWLARIYRAHQPQDVVTPIADIASSAGSGGAINQPSVTTDLNGRLVVCLVSVADDGTIGAFSGTTGGTFTEAFQELDSALGSGSLIQAQSAAKTSQGTVSGGSVTPANPAAWSAVAFSIGAY